MQEPPFRFGQVVSDQYFVGRAAEIASLTADLRSATNVVLISPRRFGKTSLVLRVLRELEREGVLVAYVDLLRTPSKERFASHFASAMYHGLLGRGAQVPEQGEGAHMFLGSRQHLLRKVFADRHQPLYRLARPMPLGPIEAAAFAPYIRERFAAGRSQITADGIEALLEITAGQPNDTQELAHFAWVRAVAEETPATRETVQHALGEVVSAESARFIVIWGNLSPLQRRALTAAAYA